METSTNSCGQTPSSSDPTASSSRIRRRRHLFSRTDALEMQNISSQRSQTDLRVMPTGRPVPRGTPINADEDEVLKVVLYHESFAFSRFGQEVKDMPKLGDLTNYDISEEKEKELWKYEVWRLVDIVNHPDRALSYHGTETLGGDTRDAYETLTSLSNRFLSCMNIIILDDELILREHMSKLHNGERFQKSRQMLKRLIDEESTQADLQKGTPEDYFNFVDYNTALLARLFCASAHGGAWHNGCLAVLANCPVYPINVRANAPDPQ
ncbi:hypothetical protein K440DRAFT_659451 [Wilcoxina mikolae CBS 423.85]|nr:hypothetical protein K440DRAFT_659451 [Wilcoxina mikolae CBS 423.85]